MGVNDISGQTFNMLYVEKLAYLQGTRKRPYYECTCSCGNKTVVRAENIKSGAVKSCGCLVRNQTCSITHGKRKHPLYGVWQNMKNRCYNKNVRSYKNYGRKGVTVCDLWLHDFQCFFEWAINNGWTENLEIDREDNGLGYSPDNCRVVSRKINLTNKGMYSSNKTGYVGISLRKDGRFLSAVSVNGKTKYLGLFIDIKSAVVARNNYIIEHGLHLKIQQV